MKNFKYFKFFNVLLFIYLVFICFVESQVILGEFKITQTGFTIDASAVNTKINYLIDDSLTTPKLVITSLSGGVENLGDIAKLSDDEKSVTFADYTLISSSSKNVNVYGLKMIVMFIIGLVTLGLVSSSSSSSSFKRSNGGSLSFIISTIVIVGVFITVSNSIVLNDVSLNVDIKVPSNFKFTELNLNLGSGSTSVLNLVADSLTIDTCSNGLGKDHDVTLNQITISKLLKVCNTKDITLKKFQVSNSASIDLKTAGNVNVNFYNGYSGQVLIVADKLTIDQTSCQITTSGTSSNGKCNGGDTSKLDITGHEVTVDNVAITCPIDSKWRPVAASSVSSTSPPISTVQPSTELLFGQSNLNYMAWYGAANVSVTNKVDGDDSEFSVLFKETWAPNSFYLVSKKSAPSIKANTDYQLTLDFKLGQPFGTYTNYPNMTISFYDPSDLGYFTWTYRAPIYSKTFTGDFKSDTEYKTTTVTFNSPIDIGLSNLVLQVNRTLQSGPSKNQLVWFRNLKMVILSKPVTTPTLLTKDSELVVIPKPPAALDAQDSSTCPYLASDLVHFHDPATWPNGVVPQASTNIVIPAGKRVLISPCSISQTDIYQKITIPVDSELVFADSDFTMHIKDIYVQGKFTMGTSKCRYNANINIVFHGEKTFDDTIAQYYGSKGIAVAAGGFISVQGKQYHQTWTKLAATAWSGDRIIYVQDNINWEVGQQVLITTSVYKDELDNQNEVLTIKAIQGKVIEFTSPLVSYHFGGQEYQSEVALLTRRIVFQGDAESSDKNLFGGHVLVAGEGQFSGIQLKKMGQQNVKARYPLHYHLAKEVKNSYISDCSVTNSYYRCYTIHGTNNVTLTRNVAFDVYGHCYYLEDGVEMDNTLSFNLGAYVHTIGKPAAGPSQVGEVYTQNDNLTQPADSAAGCFYITNAWNTFIGNSASGGWAGFAFPNLDKPIGNHRTVPMVPKAYPIKVFEGNTAHSSGYYFVSAASIYVGGNLTFNEQTQLLVYNTGRFERNTFKNGNVTANVKDFMRFNNTKIYLSNLGIGHWGTRVETVWYESHDSIRPVTLFGEAWLSRAIINGQSNNILSKTTSYTRQGFGFYDTYVQTILSHITFRNYIHNPKSTSPDDDNKVIVALTFSDVFKPQQISATIDVTLENVAPSQIIGHKIVEDSGSSRFFNFIDWDGSLIGKKGTPSIIGAHEKWWSYNDSKCSFKNDWTVWVCDKGSKDVTNIQFWIPGLVDRDTTFPGNSYIGNVSLFGEGITDQRKTAITRNAGITGIGNMGWYLYLTNGSPASMQIWLAQIPYGTYIFLAIPYPAQTTFKISSEYRYNSQNKYPSYVLVNSAAEVRAGNGTLYHFDGTHLFVKLVNHALKSTSTDYFERDGARISDVYWEYTLSLTANNTATPPVNGYYPVADVLPSSKL